jgi:ribonuclease VapC
MSHAVLDASALMVYLNDEQGAETVERALVEGAYMSVVHWIEVLSAVAELGEAPSHLASEMAQQGVLHNSLEVLPLTAEDAVSVAELSQKALNRELDMSDRVCLSLAKRLQVPIMTADTSWEHVNAEVEICLIR